MGQQDCILGGSLDGLFNADHAGQSLGDFKTQKNTQLKFGTDAMIDPETERDPNYQTWLDELAKVCTCTPAGERPCDGLLAGGLCDDRHTDERGDQFAE